jgi:hypothetical protein
LGVVAERIRLVEETSIDRLVRWEQGPCSSHVVLMVADGSLLVVMAALVVTVLAKLIVFGTANDVKVCTSPGLVADGVVCERLIEHACLRLRC